MLRSLALTMCLSFSSTAALASEPEIFAPGVISGPANDAGPTFTPDGASVYFFRNNGDDYDILVSHRHSGHWSTPLIAPFSGRWRDLEPAMAPDGSYLIFASSRPVLADEQAIDGSWGGQDYPGRGGNLWRVDRDGPRWSKPTRLPDTVNRSNAVFSPSVAANGTLYFMEASGEGQRFHLFYSSLRAGQYQPPQALPFTIEAYGDFDPAIAPDESFIVFTSNRPPAPPGKSRLFIALRTGDVWGQPVSLPETINKHGGIIESHLGPDGHTLYFSSKYVVPVVYPKDAAMARRSLAQMAEWNNGSGNIWRIDIGPYLHPGD